MIKRIFGWILFAWMLACLVGLFVDDRGPHLAGSAAIAVKVGTAIFLAAIAVIGLMIGLGMNTDTGPPKSGDQ